MSPRDVKPAGSRERWHGHRAERRASLVDSAIEAVRRHGAGVGMDEIAAAAGVSKPILYRHFTDRADLWLAVGQKVTDELLTAISAQLESPLAPRQLIAGVVDVYLGMIESDTELYRFIVRGGLVERGAGSALVEDHMDVMAERIARLLGDHLRSAGRDSGGAEVWAHGLVGLVQAAADWWMDRRTLSRAAVVEYVCALLTGGIAGLFGGQLPGDEAGVLQVMPGGA
ncbi:MAG: TetR/AcrR family transcriptional regulator [Candidatus Dormibacteria bacterium]